MNQVNQQMSGSVGNRTKPTRKARALASLSYGLFMFLFVNGCDFLTHPHLRVSDTKELIWLPLSLLIWVGSSYALSEWHAKRLERQDARTNKVPL